VVAILEVEYGWQRNEESVDRIGQLGKRPLRSVRSKV
jgi:hypothetical protein